MNQKRTDIVILLPDKYNLMSRGMLSTHKRNTRIRGYIYHKPQLFICILSVVASHNTGTNV